MPDQLYGVKPKQEYIAQRKITIQVRDSFKPRMIFEFGSSVPAHKFDELLDSIVDELYRKFAATMDKVTGRNA